MRRLRSAPGSRNSGPGSSGPGNQLVPVLAAWFHPLAQKLHQSVFRYMAYYIASGIKVKLAQNFIGNLVLGVVIVEIQLQCLPLVLAIEVLKKLFAVHVIAPASFACLYCCAEGESVLL